MESKQRQLPPACEYGPAPTYIHRGDLSFVLRHLEREGPHWLAGTAAVDRLWAAIGGRSGPAPRLTAERRFRADRADRAEASLDLRPPATKLGRWSRFWRRLFFLPVN